MSELKLQIRHPNGQERVTVPGASTLGDFIELLASKTGMSAAELQISFGFPPKPLIAANPAHLTTTLIPSGECVTIQRSDQPTLGPAGRQDPANRPAKRARPATEVIDLDGEASDETIEPDMLVHSSNSQELDQLAAMFDRPKAERALELCGSFESALQMLLSDDAKPASIQPPAAPGASDESFRFLSYNIWFDPLEQPARMHQLGQLIASSRADFIGAPSLICVGAEICVDQLCKK